MSHIFPLRMRYSKLIHWLLVLSLLCPFFYSGCEEKKSESIESTVAESQSEVTRTDTLEKAALPEVTRANEATEMQDSDELSTSKKLSKKYPLGRWLLMPDENIYTGLGVFVDGLMLLPYVGVTVFVLLLLIGLVVKYKVGFVTQSLLYVEGVAAFMLGIAQPLQWPGLRLWGFWLALVLALILLGYDALLYRRRRKGATS